MSQNNKEVIVVVPIYKNNLDPYEKTSLDYCKQYLNRHDILIISPQSLSKDLIFLDFIKKERLDVHYFKNRFFDGLDGYNSLMLNLDFYKTFLDYRYILIYQLDALVFSDDLLKWAKEDYDYIGAPWLSGGENTIFDSAGNGGFSLRKVETFISVLESKDLFDSDSKYYETCNRANFRSMFLIKIFKKLKGYNLSLNYLKLFLFFYKENEDYFWAFFAKFFTKRFKLATMEDSLKFSFEVNPSFCFSTNEKKLPFGAHAWQRYDLEFWLNHVEGLDDILSKNTEAITKNNELNIWEEK
ncbi:MAG: hypothetical protein KAI79_13470 [Bacteroidales bacterium]|nr:hypothetical protein [Bacteroidales bacterium]